MRHQQWRSFLDPQDPDYADPADEEDDCDPPEPTDDPAYLGPPDFEGSAAYRYSY